MSLLRDKDLSGSDHHLRASEELPELQTLHDSSGLNLEPPDKRATGRCHPRDWGKAPISKTGPADSLGTLHLCSTA